MAINLKKGQKIDLSKSGSGASGAPGIIGGVGGSAAGGGLVHIRVGLGWDEAQPAKSSGGFLSSLFGSNEKSLPIDCDASVLLCGTNGKLISTDPKKCCVFFGNLSHPSGAIKHQGDNLTGEGEGDDEVIMVDLSRIPAEIEKLIFVINIYDGHARNQHFGMIRNAYVRLVDNDDKKEFCRFDLNEQYDGCTGIVVGAIYRKNGVWKFSAMGEKVKNADRLDAFIAMFK